KTPSVGEGQRTHRYLLELRLSNLYDYRGIGNSRRVRCEGDGENSRGRGGRVHFEKLHRFAKLVFSVGNEPDDAVDGRLHRAMGLRKQPGNIVFLGHRSSVVSAVARSGVAAPSLRKPSVA